METEQDFDVEYMPYDEEFIIYTDTELTKIPLKVFKRMQVVYEHKDDEVDNYDAVKLQQDRERYIQRSIENDGMEG